MEPLHSNQLSGEAVWGYWVCVCDQARHVVGGVPTYSAMGKERLDMAGIQICTLIMPLSKSCWIIVVL